MFVRISAAMALLPAFGEQVTPMRIKLGLAAAFSLIAAPAIWDTVSDAMVGRVWTSLLATEVIAGLALGLLFRFFVIVLQIAGTVAAQSTSLSQIFGGGLGAEPQPAMSTLLVVAGICLATMAGLHIQVVEAIILSYDLFKPGNPISAIDLTNWGVEKIAQTFSLGVSLAGPFILASMLYNLALGAINRAMPQLMVAFVGAPAISLGGLVILFLTAPLMLSIWLRALYSNTDLLQGAF